jgi:hypothetical protein
MLVALVVGESASNVFGGMGLRELVLSAPVQPATSKTGAASGASALHANHSAPLLGLECASSIKQLEVEPRTVVSPRMDGTACCVLCAVSVAVEPMEQSPSRPATDSCVVSVSVGLSLHKSLPGMPTVQLSRGHVRWHLRARE